MDDIVLPSSQQLARHWPLDPDLTFLNHGSFGCTPWPVLHAQSEWRARMERDPIQFLDVELERRLDETRTRLANFLGVDADDLVFVSNATTGVNTVLRSLDFQPDDEILTTNHDYNACLNAIRDRAGKTGAKAVVATVPFPPESDDEIVDAVLERAGTRTRLAVISHVTSPTALILPIGRIVSALAERGIDTLVDGAHTGYVPGSLDELGAAYYTGNTHKWLCAPKGAGFLHVRRDRQDRIRPLVVSHGANLPRIDRARFLLEFDWTGTTDPTAYLSIPAALDFFENLLPGGYWQAMKINRETALAARTTLAAAVPQARLPPASMIGAMATIELPADLPPPPPDMPADAPAGARWPADPLHGRLLAEHAIQVPAYAWPHTPEPGHPRRRLLRISAQLYNSRDQYARLAAVLSELQASPDRTRSARP
jgi:isopenicillin-N epimerase